MSEALTPMSCIRPPKRSIPSLTLTKKPGESFPLPETFETDGSNQSGTADLRV